uniref:MULE transposase domain-containing protein n=1 Tax=Aegilops tauschii subsp. strangulata TaxID=200361 RepID=A0A453B2L7_AEGTS
VLQRICWAFGQSLQAFSACRPVLCIKGTPLCGKYQGVLLTAVALDANNFSIPVAYAIVECETKESWLWFLRNLERAVVHQADVCIIHDYKKELIDAVEDLLNSRRRQGLKAESRWCMEHLAENFYAYFGDKNLPLSAMVEVTFLRLEEYFRNTGDAANKAIGNPSVSFPERVQDDMNSKMQKAEMHQVLGSEEALFMQQAAAASQALLSCHCRLLSYWG